MCGCKIREHTVPEALRYWSLTPVKNTSSAFVRLPNDAITVAFVGRSELRDLFNPEPVIVLAVHVVQPAAQPGLFQHLAQAFPELIFYDANLLLTLRSAAATRRLPAGMLLNWSRMGKLNPHLDTIRTRKWFA